MEEQKAVEVADEGKEAASCACDKSGIKDRMTLPVPNVIKLAKESGSSALGSWVGLVLMVAVVAALLVGLPMILPVPSGYGLAASGLCPHRRVRHRGVRRRFVRARSRTSS